MVLIFLFIASLIGSRLLAGLQAESCVERFVLRNLSGLVVCALFICALGVYSFTVAVWSLGLFAIAVICHGWLRSWTLRKPQFRWPASFSLSPIEQAAVGTCAVSMSLAFVTVWAPATGWDGAVAHLSLAAAYAREGRLTLQPGNVYSGYPHFMHGLFAAIFSFDGEHGVTFLNWWMALMACGSVYALGRRLGGRRAGAIAAGLLASAPIFVDQTAGVSIDLAFVAYVTSALALLVRSGEAPDHMRVWTLAGALAGSACGIRHTGYLVCLLLLLAVPMVKAETPRAKRLLLFGASAALCATPWLLRSALLTGNPVFPFLLDFFPSHGIAHVSVDGAQMHGSLLRTGGFGLTSLIRFPVEIVLRPYDGWMKSPGLMVLVLGIPGLFIGGRPCRWLGAYCGAGMMAFYLFQRLARYILPFFVPMMAVAAVTEQRAQGDLRRVVQGLILTAFLSGLVLQGASAWRKLPGALHLVDRETYLTQRVERYAAFAYLNRLEEPGGVLTLDQRSYFLRNRESFQNHWALKRLATEPGERQRQWLRDQRIRFVLYPRDFVQASGDIASIAPMLDAWEADTAHFRVLQSMETPGLRGAKSERVDIIEVLHER